MSFEWQDALHAPPPPPVALATVVGADGTAVQLNLVSSPLEVRWWLSGVVGWCLLHGWVVDCLRGARGSGGCLIEELIGLSNIESIFEPETSANFSPLNSISVCINLPFGSSESTPHALRSVVTPRKRC